jgi:hypothetical protein
VVGVNWVVGQGGRWLNLEANERLGCVLVEGSEREEWQGSWYL